MEILSAILFQYGTDFAWQKIYDEWLESAWTNIGIRQASKSLDSSGMRIRDTGTDFVKTRQEINE